MEPEAEPDSVHSAIGVGSVGAGEVEEVRPEEANDATVELDDVVEVAGAEDVEDVELATLEVEFKERKWELEAKRQAATATATVATAMEGGSASEATMAWIEWLVQAHMQQTGGVPEPLRNRGWRLWVVHVPARPPP